MSQTIPNIKSFEDACTALGIDPVLPDVSMLPESSRSFIVAIYKLSKIVEALNGDWVADWTNDDQYKYFAWFDLSSGSSSSCVGYDYGFSDSAVGSRLAFASRELAKYAGVQFADLYTEMMLVK